MKLLLKRKVVLLLIGLLASILIFPARLSSQVRLINPKPEAICFQSSLNFSWSPLAYDNQGISYHLKIAEDSLFQQNLRIFTTTLSSQTVAFPNESKYFWKVIALKNGSPIDSSDNREVTFSILQNLPQINLYFSTDSGLQTGAGNKLNRWTNFADTSLSAIENVDSLAPTLINSVSGLNQQAAIRFDGLDERLTIGPALGMAELYTVANYTGGPTFSGLRTLISGTTIGVIFRAQSGSTNFGASQVFGSNIFINEVQTNNFAPLQEHKFIYGRIAGTYPLSGGLLIGSNANLSGRFWQGDLGDIIGFSAPVSDSVSDIVKSHFCQKYGRVLDLGPDTVLSYGFCDQQIVVDPNYTSYSWSNGGNQNTITLAAGESATLTVTDSLGCTFKDDIAVDIAIKSPASQPICPGDTFIWDTGLPQANYTFNWSDNSSDSILKIFQSGTYFLSIVDTNNCQFFSDTLQFQVDSSLASIDLLTDTSLCRSSVLNPSDSGLSVANYIWSTGNTQRAQLIDTAGLYTLEVSINGCVVRDTANISLIGEKPIADFSASNFYLSADDSVSFTDQSQVNGAQINSWNWQFGDGGASSSQNPFHTYSSLGTYVVELIVQSNLGCRDTVAKPIDIIPAPPIIYDDFESPRIGLVYPKANQIVFDSILTFHWSDYPAREIGQNYKIELSTDSNFSSVIFSNQGLQTQIQNTLSSEGVYYWRVVLENNGEQLLSSPIEKFTYTTLYNLPNISLLFLTDTGLQLSAQNQIRRWQNLADTGLSAINLFDSVAPTLVTNVVEVNSQSALRFDGVDDRLSIAQSMGLSELHTIANYSGTAPFSGIRALITGRTSGVIFRAQSGTTFFGPSQVFNNSIYINQQLSNDFAPFGKHKLVSGRLGGTFPLPGGILIGSNANNPGTFWQGDIGDIVGFNQAISDSVRAIVTAHFCSKYGKPLDLGPDISPTYGFCDTLLIVDSTYTSYQWSNGDTSRSSSLLPGENYTLTVTNQLGCVYIDEIRVGLPTKALKSQVICPSDTFIWEVGLANSNYEFEWNDGTKDSVLKITSRGNYSYTVIDTNDCEYHSDTVFVDVDSTLIGYSLGPDTALCRFGAFEAPQLDTISQYNWSNGINMPSTPVDTAGIYAIQLFNGRCFAQDTIQIGIAGELPNVDFGFQNQCFGDSISFIDSSSAAIGDTLDNWKWKFGDGILSLDSNPKHIFSQAGIYQTTLVVTTKVGCQDSITKGVNIFNKPRAWFGSTPSCAKDFVRFNDSSSISNGSIVSYAWDFGDLGSGDTSILSHPGYTYDTLGNYIVSLKVTSDKGCVDSVQKVHQVSASPNVEFVFSGNCLNDSTYFTNQTYLANDSIVEYKWFFNYGIVRPLGESTRENPVTQFSDTGLTIISLRATTNKGCVGIHRDSLYMKENPNAAFQFGVVCEGAAFSPINNANAIDSINTYTWVFNGSDSSTSVTPTFSAQQAGTYPLSQKVQTIYGCVDSISRNIIVYPNPEADFRILNNGSGAPYQLRVSNQSIGASSYLWATGRGDTLNGFEPSYTYPDTGTFNLSLIAQSDVLCKDTVQKNLVVNSFLLKVLLEEIDLSRTADGRISLASRLANVGNNTIESLRLLASLNNQAQIVEDVNQIIYKGDRLGYQFNASFLAQEGMEADFVCIKIDQVNGRTDFQSDQRVLCESALNDRVYLDLYPNPASNFIQIDYVIPFSGEVSIYFYDALGREVISHEMGSQVAGYYTIRQAIDKLGQGVYHYMFKFNGSSQSGSFIKE